MIKLIIIELKRLIKQPRWLVTCLFLFLILFVCADRYFKIYPNFNNKNEAIYQSISSNINRVIIDQQNQLEDAIANDDKIAIASLQDSLASNTAQHQQYLNLNMALINNDWQTANQILITLGNNDITQIMIRTELIEANIDTIHINPISVGSVYGFFSYLINTNLWLIIVIFSIIIGYDVINEELKNKTLSISFLQPYRITITILSKIIARTFLAIILISFTFIFFFLYLKLFHQCGWLDHPVVYSPLSLFDRNASFTTTMLMSLKNLFGIITIHLLINISLVISFCALLNCLIRKPFISLIVLITLTYFIYQGIVNKQVPSYFVYNPYYYLFLSVHNFLTNEHTSLFYYYRNARLSYGLITMSISTFINYAITTQIWKRKELR